MKNLVKKFNLSFNAIFIGVFGLLLVGGGCTLDPQEFNPDHHVNNLPNQFEGKLELAKEILLQSENSEFRDLVYQLAGEKSDGDFNFLLQDLEFHQKKSRIFFDSNILSLISANQNQENGLQIYIPNFEKTLSKRINGSDAEIVLVFQELDESIKEVDGFKLVGEELIKLDYKITEDNAVNHEIWVLGYNERIGLDNFLSIDRNSRTIGAGEYIYQIQVPDLSAIEHWTAGAIELTARVATQKSGDALVYTYGDISRGDLKDKKWKTMNTFIANWTTTSIGDYMKVHWTERDGGNGDLIKITLTMPKSENVPIDTKVEFTIRSKDDNLGHQIVQFSDSESQIYSTGLISWKMKSQ